MLYPKCTIPKEICQQRDANGYCKMGILCMEIVEECEGCSRIDNGYCSAYINPKAKWSAGKQCPLASHLEAKKVEVVGKIRSGQQKQKKKTRK